MTMYSKLIAGTMTWGSWGKNFNQNQTAEMIELCVANRITTFDHADIYGGYTTEADFGKAFRQSGIDRESVQFISKCGIQYPSESRPFAIKHYDYSAKHIRWSVENSLSNLQTDYLDLLLLHRPSPLMNTSEVVRIIAALKTEGKIRDFGLSNFTSSQTELIRTKVNVAVNQIQFSATHLEPMTDGSLDYMQQHQIIPMAWNPLGTIFKEVNEQTQRIDKLVTKLAIKYEVGVDQILLAWILKHPAGIIPVCGTTTPARISELMKATDIEMDLEDWFAIWVKSRGTKVP